MVEKMSMWSLVANASLVVQLVMLILLLVSVVSWVMIFQRRSYLASSRRSLRQFEENIFRAGIKEFTRLRQQSDADPDAVMEGVQRAMRVALSREEEKLDAHLPFLATVGSTSPYIGLFGTVWGIMNSFRGLANMHQATLASVAPGISEALIATAMGLFAAIPAVIAYNRYSSQVEILMNGYATFAEEFSSILHRRVHGSS